MSKVFITQESRHLFTDAEQYGELVFLTNDDLWGIKDSAHNEDLVFELARKLRGFNAEDDWVVIAGSPYVAAAVFLHLGNKGIRGVKLLRWDRQYAKYSPIHLQLRREV